MPRKSRPHSPAAFAGSFGLAALHTGITLWYRWPMLAQAAADVSRTGHTARQGELTRMVSEKASAAVAGTVEAQAEAMRLGVKAMTGKLSPGEWANAPASIMAAGLRPAYRSVRANARRLNKPTAG